jgi:hypothetical protein
MIAGCGSGDPTDMVPIRGEVIYAGKPLTEGFIVYLPKNPGNGRQANGPIQPDGSFVLTTQKGGDGAMCGEYDIVVFSDKAPANENMSRQEYEASAKRARRSNIPTKYSDRNSSGLHDRVDQDHSGFKRIELEG